MKKDYKDDAIMQMELKDYFLVDKWNKTKLSITVANFISLIGFAF